MPSLAFYSAHRSVLSCMNEVAIHGHCIMNVLECNAHHKVIIITQSSPRQPWSGRICTCLCCYIALLYRGGF